MAKAKCTSAGFRPHFLLFGIIPVKTGRQEECMGEILCNVPVVALKGINVLPDTTVHFDVSRKSSVEALESAMKGNQKLFVVTQKNMEQNEPEEADLYRVGVVAEVKQIVRLPGGMLRALVENGRRALLQNISHEGIYMTANVLLADVSDSELTPVAEEAMCRVIRDLLGQYAMENTRLNKETIGVILRLRNIYSLMNKTISCLPLYYDSKQRFLEAETVEGEYELLVGFLKNEAEISKIKKELQEKVKQKVEKNQKDYILREQMKIIRQELGEEDTVSEADTYMEQTKALNADSIIKERLEKEIKRFKGLSAGSSESNVARGYIEALLEMPWNNMSKDNLDINNAEKILNRDHYGLEKVKERVLEFLAVKAYALKENNGKDLNGKSVSPVICLVGPPGTGKTSIARSVAEALGKKYVRICLGGVRDEAEIRGHRKTYVGAMPGRFVTALKQAKVSNPLILLDEIDKLGSDYKGDPASALLEVLDGEQNSHFRDNYMEVPIDLSNVLFIATANDVQTIPRPLLDRMELIEISGYTAAEKEHIALEHLVDKQRKAHCLKKSQLSISRKAVQTIIGSYTREAGVRNLERAIGKVCRKATKDILNGSTDKIKITDKNLSDYLGKKKYLPDKANEKDDIGIVRGLAWTSVGGDTLEIEVNTYRGKGELILTGQMGDVMKESASAGISYIRSVAEKYHIENEFFTENDIQIHIPEGAVPKDGPSAGITMAAAVLSAITGKKVKASIAMTGEITLRGRVLPIGGLKEKLLAAKLAGIKTVLVPKKNEADVEEIPSEIKDGLTIKLVENMEQVVKEAFVNENKKS